MRMRRKKNLDSRMEACAQYLEPAPQGLKGNWAKRAGGRPIYIEVGCGKGRFVVETALANPDKYFVAVEMVPSVLVVAMEKAKALGPDNLTFLSLNAAVLGDVFGPDEVTGIYLNFSDPWPPKRHWKRRLTHFNMLRIYDSFLLAGGEIAMKTDNSGLFEFSLCQFSQFGYTLFDITLDLHKTDTPNIMTEYEQQFSQKGMNIYRCVAKKPG